MDIVGVFILIIVVVTVYEGLSNGTSCCNADCKPNNNMYKSDKSITGAVITNNPATWPGCSLLWNICAAVAMAEGYNRGAGYVPYDLNNPGDLSDYASSYGSQLHDGSQVTTFPTAETGWNALYNKWSAIISGTSTSYPAGSTWAQIAAIWAGNSSAWLNNVTNYLGVDPNDTPGNYVNQQVSPGS
jgi:hypothetical protein